jgi:hypothetical protein
MVKKMETDATRLKLIACGYQDAMDLAMEVRLDRKELYGDKWKTESTSLHLEMVKMKTRRIDFLLNTSALPGGTEERKLAELKDSAIDLVNYSLFLLETLK